MEISGRLPWCRSRVEVSGGFARVPCLTWGSCALCIQIANPKLRSRGHSSSPGLPSRVKPCGKSRTASQLRGLTPAAIPLFSLPRPSLPLKSKSPPIRRLHHRSLKPAGPERLDLPRFRVRRWRCALRPSVEHHLHVQGGRHRPADDPAAGDARFRRKLSPTRTCCGVAD